MVEIPEKPIESGPIPENIEDQSLKRREAEEFLDTQRDKTERTWPTEQELQELPDRAAKIIEPKGAITPVSQEPNLSDKTQQFVERFNQAKSHSEAIKIMNEALTAVEKGDIPPDEVNQILDRASDNQDVLNAA